MLYEETILYKCPWKSQVREKRNYIMQDSKRLHNYFKVTNYKSWSKLKYYITRLTCTDIYKC